MKGYSKEFKSEALKLSDEIGVKKAAEQLGLHYNTIADWRKLKLSISVGTFITRKFSQATQLSES